MIWLLLKMVQFGLLLMEEELAIIKKMNGKIIQHKKILFPILFGVLRLLQMIPFGLVLGIKAIS